MNLKIQIISLLFSFLFGIFFSLFLKINNKIIYNNFLLIRFIGSFFVVLVSVLTYFIFLQKINNSYFHPYLLFMIILGYFLENLLIDKTITIVKRHKRWYTFIKVGGENG